MAKSSICQLLTKTTRAQYLRFIYKKIHYLTQDLEFGVQVSQNFSKDPLDHVTYAHAKFEVATSNGLGGDAITRNVTDRQSGTHGR